MMLSRHGPAHTCSGQKHNRHHPPLPNVHFSHFKARSAAFGRVHAFQSHKHSTHSTGSQRPHRDLAARSAKTEDGVFTVDFPDAPLHATKDSSIDYFDQWYPVGFIKDFDLSTPHRFILLGIPLVIWQQPAAAAAASGNGPGSSSSSSSDGSWRVFADVCPHRLVPLSEGRITADGLLECPYHGWTFNGQGGCTHIPQQGHNATPRACATTFPCVVKQGMLFVKPKAQPKKPVQRDQLLHTTAAAGSNGSSSSSSSVYDDVPITPDLESQGWLVQDTWRDVPYDWSSLMENVLDASHVPFTHHKSISDRNAIGAYDVHISEPVSRTGFRSMWNTGPRAGALGPQSSWYRPPCFMMQKIDAKENKGYESLVVVYAVPIAPGRCRLLNRNAFRFTKGGGLAAWAMKLVPGWATHLGTQIPLEDDQIFLHLGEEQYVAAAAQGKSAAQAYYMPSPADTNVVAFRRWIEQFGGGGPFGDVGRASYRAKLQPRQQHAQLLDRYSQHTAHCAQCQKGLKQVQRTRSILLAAARVTGVIGLLSAAAGISAAALAAAAGPAAAAAAPAGALSGVVAAVGALVLPLPPGADATAAAGIVTAAAVGRALKWLGAAAVFWFVNSKLGEVDKAFYTGTYPPPRNTDKN